MSELIPGTPGSRIVSFKHEVDGPLSALKSVTFFDADGKEMKSRSNGTSSYPIGNTTRSGRSDSLEKRVAKATVCVTYFDMEDLIVPIDVAVGIRF